MTPIAFDVDGFLAEPGRPASVATVTARGRPALATMWFLVANGRLWFNSPVPEGPPAPFLDAAAARHDVAVLVATFDPPGDIRQFRATGPARVERTDPARVRAIYARYVPAWTDDWDQHTDPARFRMWSMAPHRGMVVSYTDLEDGPSYRWSRHAAAPGCLRPL